MFNGYITALITPFREGEIDWKAFDDLIEWQIQEGIHGLVPCGTTGESPALSHQEHADIITRCVKQVRGRVPVIAGCGSNSTREALDFTRHAREVGANAALHVTPYYNKPTQEGLYAHFATLQEEGLPVIIYNIPGRSVVDMHLNTMIRLASLPHIIGVKDATADLTRPLGVREKIGADFCQLSGEDGTIVAFLAQGGHGCISVTSNVAPNACVCLYEAWVKADLETMALWRDRLAPLSAALFCETSPAPAKYALSYLGFCSDEVRLPLVPASEGARMAVNQALNHLGITDQTLKKQACA